MPDFLQKHWMTIFLVVVILIALGLAASEYLDAATSLLPGGEGGGAS